MDQFQTFLDYVVQVGPSVVSVLGMILSVVVSIARQGKLNSNQIAAIDSVANEIRQDNAEVKEDNKKIRALLKVVIKENAELKVQLIEQQKANSNIVEAKHE